MMNKAARDQLWIEAAKRYNLSPAHVKMARELGMNPKKLGGMANHKQERWKAPLPQFIEELYERRFREKKANVVRPSGRSPEEQERNAVSPPAPETDDELPF
jgi:hypothetical protein